MQHGDPERRVDDLGREVFERAVSIAAAKATEAVARLHRRRLVVQSSAGTFVLCMGIALILAIVFKSEAEGQARANALKNCRLIREVASPLASFVSSDATLRANVPVGSNALNAAVVHEWRRVIVPELQAVAGANCRVRAG